MAKVNESVTSAAEETVNAKKRYTLKKFWKDWGDTVVFLAVLIILLRVVFQIIWVPSGSMETTIPTKSLLIGWRLPYVFSDKMPEYGDVMTFQSDELGIVLIKRVIGLPGDVIKIENGEVYRNGNKLEEPYLLEQGVTYGEPEYTVPEGSVFFMGDNRLGSFDARGWQQPYIDGGEIQAKALVVFSFGKDHAWQGVRLMTR